MKLTTLVPITLVMVLVATSVTSASLLFPPSLFRSSPFRSLLFDDINEWPFSTTWPAAVATAQHSNNNELRMLQQENVNQLVLTMDLPGLRREEVQVAVKDSQNELLLSVDASHKCPQKSSEEWWCREQTIKQTYRLDARQLDMDSARVQHRDGVLRILINKKQPVSGGGQSRVLPIIDDHDESPAPAPKMTVQQQL
jgi:HSP20 family molecular chaperone IbpA